MKLSKTAGRILVLAAAFLPLLFLAILYPDLPDNVPIHYDSDMQPNDFASKGSLWLLHGGLSVMAIGIYFLLRNIHLIDPKRKGQGQSATFNKLAAGLVIILTILQTVILLAAAGHQQYMQQGIFATVGVLFMFLGNYMHSIKPNYFAGFRLPWTLEDPENWRLTHRLGGKLFVAAGIAMVVAGLVLKGTALMVAMFAIIAVATVVPVVYSWRIFREWKGLESGE